MGRERYEPETGPLRGSLEGVVLRTLVSIGPFHGYDVARGIEPLSQDEVLSNQATVYAPLVRHQNRGWITTEWGASENNEVLHRHPFGTETAG